MNDLLGEPIKAPPPIRLDHMGREKPRRKPTPKNGYAGTPGCGPKGETCGSCTYLEGRFPEGGSRKFKKCYLSRHRWTHGPGSDILVKSPACEKWEAK